MLFVTNNQGEKGENNVSDLPINFFCEKII